MFLVSTSVLLVETLLAVTTKRRYNSGVNAGRKKGRSTVNEISQGKSRVKSKTKEKDYHHGDLRHALLGEALKVIEAEGAEQLTLRDLARRIGVSHAAPYRHFSDKAELFVALAEEGFKELLAALSQVEPTPNAGMLARFQEIAVVYVQFALRNPARFSVMFGPEVSATCGENPPAPMLATMEFVLKLMEKGQAEGQLVPGQPIVQATTAWALVHGLSVLLINHKLKDKGLEKMAPEELARAVTASLATGLLTGN